MLVGQQPGAVEQAAAVSEHCRQASAVAQPCTKPRFMQFAFDAGALVLADRGVCCIGERVRPACLPAQLLGSGMLGTGRGAVCRGGGLFRRATGVSLGMCRRV